MQALDLQIRVHGWALVQVADDSSAWCYTVGLIENFGHPELVLFDVEVEKQHPLMTHLVDLVTSAGALPVHRLVEMKLQSADVHPDHLDSDLFGTWANRYGEFPQPGDMIHIRLPAGAYCACHAPLVRRLDLPGPLPPPAPAQPAPNRAERRRDRRTRGA